MAAKRVHRTEALSTAEEEIAKLKRMTREDFVGMVEQQPVALWSGRDTIATFRARWLGRYSNHEHSDQDG